MGLIIYAIIAGAVCFMLYMVLGKQVGEAPDSEREPIVPILTESKASDLKPTSKHFDGPAGAGLSLIAKGDAGFSPEEFLDGAKSAYAMILEAYADGDRELLEGLLSSEMFAAYIVAIDTREEKSLTQSTDLARLISADFTEADRAGKTGSISVEFKAEIASALMNADGDVVDGDLDIIHDVDEVWTFERTLASKDPNWLLVSVVERGEDTLGSAPDFDPKSDS